MPKRPDARALLFERIRTSPPKFVHVCGVPYAACIEPSSDPLRVDHVWLTLEVPPFGRLRADLNTLSRWNRDAGFDGRIRVAVVRSTYEEKPPTGLEECEGHSYAKLDANLTYEFQESTALADSLLVKMKSAIRAEIWGELYARDHLGLHQIHSRAASSAVKSAVRKRDGALKLYYPQDNHAELFLFKFCGQA